MPARSSGQTRAPRSRGARRACAGALALAAILAWCREARSGSAFAPVGSSERVHRAGGHRTSRRVRQDRCQDLGVPDIYNRSSREVGLFDRTSSKDNEVDGVDDSEQEEDGGNGEEEPELMAETARSQRTAEIARRLASPEEHQKRRAERLDARRPGSRAKEDFVSGPYPRLAMAKSYRQLLLDVGEFESDEIGVFARWVNNAAMTFFVDTYEGFARSLAPGDSFGEVFLDGRPCWLYFDLDLSTGANPLLNSEAVLGQFSWLLSNFSADIGVPFDESRVFYLNGTRSTKFSFHVIVKGIAPFSDNFQAGRFVHAMLDHAQGLRAAGFTDLLFVKTDGDGLDPQSAPIIDVSVYSRNRVFRVLSQSKPDNSESMLRLASRGGLAPLSDPLPAQVLATLATHVPNSPRVFFSHPIVQGTRPRRQTGTTTHFVDARSVDAKWRKLVDWAVGRWDEGRADAEGAWRHPPTQVSIVEEHYGLVVHLLNNRYCQCRGRSHKRRGVFLIVDLREGVFMQRCWDKADCDHNAGGARYPLPRDLLETLRPPPPTSGKTLRPPCPPKQNANQAVDASWNVDALWNAEWNAEWKPFVQWVIREWDKKRESAEGEASYPATGMRYFREESCGINVYLRGNGYCECLGKSHERGVVLVVNLREGVFMQRCSDVNCNFNEGGSRYPLPADLAQKGKDMMLERLRMDR